MRNLTPITILMSRFRGSQVALEIFQAGIYPSAMNLKPDHVILEWTYLDRARRGVDAQFFMVLKGKSKGFLISEGGGQVEPQPEQVFTSQLLSQHIVSEDFLVEKNYEYDRIAFDKVYKALYDT